MEEEDREWPGLGRREEVRMIPKGRAKADSAFKGTRLTREEPGEGRRLPEGPRTKAYSESSKTVFWMETSESANLKSGVIQAKYRPLGESWPSWQPSSKGKSPLAIFCPEATFHVLQERMAGFWSYRTDPK